MSERHETTLSIARPTAFALLDCVAAIGNILVCSAIKRNQRLRTATNVFVVSLAFSDLISTLFCLPLSLGASIVQEWIFGYLVCQIQGYAMYILCGISIHTMTLTALNRYFRVVKPSYYGNLFSKRRSIYMAMAIWLSTSLVGFITYQTDDFYFTPNPGSFTCNPWFRSDGIRMELSIPILLIFVILPVGVIAYCYMTIYRTVKRHNMMVTPRLRGANTVIEGNRGYIDLENHPKVAKARDKEKRGENVHFNGNAGKNSISGDTIESLNDETNKLNQISRWNSEDKQNNIDTNENGNGGTTKWRRHINHLRDQRMSKRRNISEAAVTKTTFAVVVGFCACWVPVVCLAAAVVFGIQLPLYGHFMYAFLAYASGAINPFIYGVLNRDFRREFIKMLSCGKAKE